MKFLKRIFVIILTLILLSLFNTFGITSNTFLSHSVEASSIRLNTKSKTLKEKQTYKLTILGSNKKVTWNSSNKKIATVSKNGKVTAKKKGTAIITAKIGNKKYKCKITVKNNSKSSNYSNSLTVYITNTGEKYHRYGCRYLRKSCISISKSSAISRGYSACKICKP